MQRQLLAFLLILAVGAISASLLGQRHSNPFREFRDKYDQIYHPFGGEAYKTIIDEGSHSVVYLPENGLFGHPEHLQEHRQKMAYYMNNREEYDNKIQDTILTCQEEKRADFLKIIPTYIATLTPSNSTVTYSAPCFKNNTITLKIVDDTTVEILHKTEKATALGCADTYFYSTLQNFHADIFFTSGVHTITLKVNSTELQQIKTTGIFVFRTCDRAIDLIPDLFKTTYLFLGEIELAAGITTNNKSVPTEFDVKQSIEFTYETTGYVWVERPNGNVVVDLDVSLVNSGDFFAVRKFDGTGDLVEYGTGSHVNHCTVAVKINGELYIAESNSNFEWPVAGVQINPYATWVEWAKNQGYHVTWLPLKSQYASKFNTERAMQWFKSIEGAPYGIHSYIWGWVDTVNNNFPPLMSPEFLASLFAMLELSKPDAVSQIYGMGLNKRLGTVNLTVAQLAEEAYNRNMTLPELYAIVEQDGWLYNGLPSYVCSAFVAGFLKAGGLFDGMDINAVEFVPRDIYELEFYDPAPHVPANCKAVDPTNPFCQVMGKYRMEFPYVSTVPAYSHMNEHCGAEPPLYERLPQGC